MSINFRSVSFIKSVPVYNLLPQDDIGEIAFAGRSNAGKSTLINTLCENKTLTKVSSTPGKTREINLYSIHHIKSNQTSRLIDLPGYGYAKVGKSLQKIWQKELTEYLTKRENLKILILVMDARHPLSELDTLLIRMISHRSVQQILVFNKIDKLNQSEKFQLGKIIEKITYDTPNCHAIRHSSLKKLGTNDLAKKISALFESLQ